MYIPLAQICKIRGAKAILPELSRIEATRISVASKEVARTGVARIGVECIYHASNNK